MQIFPHETKDRYLQTIMASTKFYLDRRAVKEGNPIPLKLSISHNKSKILISLDIKLLENQWDEENGLILNHPEQKVLNIHLKKVKSLSDSVLLRLLHDGKLSTISMPDLKLEILREIRPDKYEYHEIQEQEKAAKVMKNNSFVIQYIKFAEAHSVSTKKIYLHTLSRMRAYAQEASINLDDVMFEDINKAWLTDFDRYLSKTSPSQNARNVHMRNIRAAFNEAITNEITTAYPFRHFKLKTKATRKRSLTVDELRTLFNYPVQDYARIHLDMFKLIFMLIGINAVDLCHLKKIVNGRVEFERAKTHRLYSIKVEEEALEIIERYRGNDWLINALDRYTNHQDFIKHINKALKKIGPIKRVGRGGKWDIKPLFPELSTYWARHSWATIAASLDIPRDTIAHALGHGNNTVTDIYIDFDQKKVDDANRKVLDWVLYGKRLVRIERYETVPMRIATP